MEPNDFVFQIKVTLRGTRPPIWRRILVSRNINLAQFHNILQVVMGWEDCHLHHFRVGNTFYGTPSDDFGMGTKNEKKVHLDEVLRKPKDRMMYEYDFGDSCEHDVVLEKIIPKNPKMKYPFMVKGKGTCPPEDIGGVWGYYEFLEAVSDPNHPNHEEMLEWHGDDTFNPDDFDADVINAYIQRH